MKKPNTFNIWKCEHRDCHVECATKWATALTGPNTNCPKCRAKAVPTLKSLVIPGSQFVVWVFCLFYAYSQFQQVYEGTKYFTFDLSFVTTATVHTIVMGRRSYYYVMGLGPLPPTDIIPAGWTYFRILFLWIFGLNGILCIFNLCRFVLVPILSAWRWLFTVGLTYNSHLKPEYGFLDNTECEVGLRFVLEISELIFLTGMEVINILKEMYV
ncbi:MAG: hypothetical protein ACTSUE_22865 [Promethearchaeota archaeon]